MKTSINHPFSPILRPARTKKANLVEVMSHGKTLVVQGQDITHLQGAGNYTFVHTQQGKKYLVCKTMKTLQVGLPDNFVRVHKSYIVNALYVTSRVHPLFLLLNSGIKVPIARRRIHQVKITTRIRA